MDGVLWRGDQPLPGLAALFAWLRERHIPYALATNNSSRTPADYAAKLTGMGVADIPVSQIITSATATAAYLSGRYPAGTRLYVVGGAGLRAALDQAGFDLETQAAPQGVVVGLDPDLTYDKLRQATLMIRAGADFYGTNGDLTYPMPEGEVPGAGSIIAALEAASGRSAIVIGKPERPMFEAALSATGTTPDTTLMVGDRLETDIAGAKALGLATVLVLTGVTTPDDLALSAIWPDVAYDDLTALIRTWAGEDWYRAYVRTQRTGGAT
jgi:4-nitrophenyl phosphatase